MSETPAFPWSRETYEGQHTVFNLTPIDSSLEQRFAQFLDTATDVAAWAKLTMNSRFALEYISTISALRYYFPDFVIRLVDDACLVVETKGLEDPDVPHKDQRARRWCRDASALAGRDWGYEKVPQKTFDAYTGSTVEGLRRFLAAQGGSRSRRHELTTRPKWTSSPGRRSWRTNASNSNRSTPNAPRGVGSS